MNIPVVQIPERVADFLSREGLGDKTAQKRWFKKGAVTVNDVVANGDTVLHPNDKLSIRGVDYGVTNSGQSNRLVLVRNGEQIPKLIDARVRVQCGYHKCLTMYFRRVSKKTAVCDNPFSGQYRHFFHRLDEFYRDCASYNISSVSGHCLDLERFSDIRAVHIIRDPRDMIVSGYYYHKRAGEPWCNYVNPTDDDWSIVNASVPKALPGETSFADYLNNVSLEEGLAAEFEFRQKHFASMMAWPTDDPRVMTVRYEDILGNEAETFRRIYNFYGLSFHTKFFAGMYANRYSLKSERRLASHIRNPKKGQWRDLFTPELTGEFNERFGDLLAKYGYT